MLDFLETDYHEPVPYLTNKEVGTLKAHNLWLSGKEEKYDRWNIHFLFMFIVKTNQ